MALHILVRPLAASLVAVLIPLTACCKKKEEAAAQSSQPGGSGLQINTGPGTGLMPAPSSDVVRYSDEGPEIGTTPVRRVAIARKAADQGSEIIHRIGAGTMVNKKARKGPFYLVEFPFTDGQMRLGWILQEDVLGAPTPTTTTTTTVSAKTSAPPAASSALPVGRPPAIRLPKK